jgi:transposase InsO family protein
MCRLYGVTPAGYHAWRRRRAPTRALEDQALLARIRRIFAASRGCYGSPRVHRALQDEGIAISNKRVARLMREAGLRARSARLYRRHAGQKAFYASVPNRQPAVAVAAPDRVWVGDVTYLKVREGWRYLAVVLDRWSRRVVGWALRVRRDAALTLAAFNRAVQARRPGPGLLFHSDRGAEFACYAFRQRLQALGVVQSMNRPMHMNDNAVMESFFKSFKSDAYHGHRFADDAALLAMVRRYLPHYNHHRRHSSLGHRSPVQFERAAC